ncbi:hypothetical protein MUK42_26096 [Musa troglodytarum]|uniref:Uncharacterized protein n=1 Tax=Musa troglodytarum TaxID=320322 RepID=A0A9E7EA77_9LILI|nr:hypothetical protein MUK42_26096 [Musa troglodytarum]
MLQVTNTQDASVYKDQILELIEQGIPLSFRQQGEPKKTQKQGHWSHGVGKRKKAREEQSSRTCRKLSKEEEERGKGNWSLGKGWPVLPGIQEHQAQKLTWKTWRAQKAGCVHENMFHHGMVPTGLIARIKFDAIVMVVTKKSVALLSCSSKAE